jgi:Fe2+ transport system protein FeoA
MTKALSELPMGQSAEIVSLDFAGLWRRRMLDLGFTAGNRITAIQTGPFGDPVAYDVLDTVIALRRCDARQIQISTT